MESMKRILFTLFLILPLMAQAQKRHEYTFDFNHPEAFLPSPIILQEPDYNGAEVSLKNSVFYTSDGLVSLRFVGREDDGRGGVFKTSWPDTIWTDIDHTDESNMTLEYNDHYLFIARGGSMIVSAHSDVELDSLIFSENSFVGNLKLVSPTGVGLIDTRNESWYGDVAKGETATELEYRNYGNVPQIRAFTVVYRSPMDVLEPVSVTPAHQSDVHEITTIDLSYAQPVKLGASAKFELTGPRGFNPVLMDAQVVGNKVVLSLPAGVTINEATVSRRGTYTLTIAAQSIIGDDEDGYFNKKTVYTFNVVEAYNKYEVASVWPEYQVEQVSEIPNGIVVGFTSGVGYFPADEIKLTDRSGNTMRTLKAQWLDESEYTEEAPYYKHDKDIYSFVKFIFSGTKTAAVKATGIYSFTIPEGFIWNDKYNAEAEDKGVSEGALFNPAFTITYNVNGVVYPSAEVLQAAQDLLAITGAGYPAADSEARIALQALVDEGIGADAIFEAAMEAFYAETNIEMPSEGYYLLSAVGSNGYEAFVSYNAGQVGLTRSEEDAAHLYATINEDGTLVFETSDHKYLTQMLPLSPNVTASLGKTNNLTFGRLVLTDEEGQDLYTPQQLFGLWSINGIVATNDEGVDVTAYALANLQTLTFGTDRDKSLRYFSDTQTNAFRLTETDAPVPAAQYYFDPASGSSLEALQRVILTFTHTDEVSVVENAKTLITMVGTNGLKYSPTKVNLIEGKKNQYLLYFEDVKAGTYTLTIPKATFTWTYDERKVNIPEITASYTLLKGIDFNYDYLNRHRVYNWDQKSDVIPVRASDLATWRMFINEEADFVVDSNRTITITDKDEWHTIASGHFEADPTFEAPGYPLARGIRFVLDEPKTIKDFSITPQVYQYNIPEGTFGDGKFGEWLKDPQAVSKRDCHVNDALSPYVNVDDDMANMEFIPKTLSYVHSMSEVIISFPYYEKVEIHGQNSIVVQNTMNGEEIVTSLERVEGTMNQFRFTSTVPLNSDPYYNEYKVLLLTGLFSCDNKQLIPSYNDREVYFFGKAGGDDAIDNIQGETQSEEIYDLAGRRIKDASKPGIYVVNGHKVLIK